jgi:hypothetical protein
LKKSRSVLLMMALVIAVPGVFSGCGEGEDAADTATISPATPEPIIDIDADDPALTQTIEPGEDRSPYEGGPLATEEDFEDPDDTTTLPPRP